MLVIKKVALLTSGSDAPGMNAAIRAVVQFGLAAQLEMYAVHEGFRGLVEDSLFHIRSPDVTSMIQKPGTILYTSRYADFKSESAQATALQNLRRLDIDAVIAIGGSGTQCGLYDLSKKGMPVVGIIATINNDVYGTDISIGVDTALNVALEAIDRLNNSASALDRAFIVEVMGRDSGYLALMAGLAGGADAIVVPEQPIEPAEVAKLLHGAYRRCKHNALAVVAEGAKYNGDALAHYFQEHRTALGFDLRLTKLGHVQRGATPTAFDRILATRLGIHAVRTLTREIHGVMVGWKDGKPATVPLCEAVEKKKEFDSELLAQAKVLSI